MGKAGTLEKQMMDAFKEKEEQEVATTAAEQRNKLLKFATGMNKNLILLGERKKSNGKIQLKKVEERIGNEK